MTTLIVLGGAVFTTGGNVEHDECIYTSGAAPGIRAIHDTLINANPAQTAAIFVDNPDYGGGGTAGTSGRRELAVGRRRLLSVRREHEPHLGRQCPPARRQ